MYIEAYMRMTLALTLALGVLAYLVYRYLVFSTIEVIRIRIRRSHFCVT